MNPTRPMVEARAGTAPRPLSGILPPLSCTGGGCYRDSWRRTRIPNKGEDEEYARQANLLETATVNAEPQFMLLAGGCTKEYSEEAGAAASNAVHDGCC